MTEEELKEREKSREANAHSFWRARAEGRSLASGAVLMGALLGFVAGSAYESGEAMLMLVMGAITLVTAWWIRRDPYAPPATTEGRTARVKEDE